MNAITVREGSNLYKTKRFCENSFIRAWLLRRMDSVLENILHGLSSWAERIFDIEEQLKRTKDIRKSVIDSLYRQVLDGFISEQDSIELERTCDLWLNLYNSCLCKSVGADFADHNLLTYLLELYTLKLITKEFFISTTLEICRN